MKCMRCDSPVSITARFCENCGAMLQGEDLDYKLAHAYRLELASRFDDAVEEYERLLEIDLSPADTAAVRKHLGNLHFRLGHLRRAREHLGKACELDPENPTLWHDLGVVAYHTADFQQAVDSFRQVMELGASQHLACFWLGNALYHQGKLEEARSAFDRLLESHPNFTIARFHLGVIYARQGMKAEAEEQFRRVLLTNPEDAAARYYVNA